MKHIPCVILGPTAGGKSALAHAVARAVGAHVLAVDSMTVYRGMDIGTAKPTPAERAEVPYHGLDLADPGERFGAFLIDGVLIIAVLAACLIGLFLLAFTGIFDSASMFWVLAAVVALLFLIRSFYFAFMEIRGRGVTPGKKWLKLRVIDRSGGPLKAEAILARMREIQEAREASQPIRTRTGGSTFANPDDPKGAGRKAWQLIDEAGCRGLRRGGAMVSEKHCNFLINTGTATADDLESLGEEVRRRVLEATGVSLRWEIRRVGLPGPVHPGEARS